MCHCWKIWSLYFVYVFPHKNNKKQHYLIFNEMLFIKRRCTDLGEVDICFTYAVSFCIVARVKTSTSQSHWHHLQATTCGRSLWWILLTNGCLSRRGKWCTILLIWNTSRTGLLCDGVQKLRPRGFPFIVKKSIKQPEDTGTATLFWPWSGNSADWCSMLLWMCEPNIIVQRVAANFQSNLKVS